MGTDWPIYGELCTLIEKSIALYKVSMGFQANVLKVMIASPGDVQVERGIITDELYRWNNANAVTRELILQPVKWETHSSPQMGAHPQAILNDDLLLDADIVVGIFGTRLERG